jgi:hypothetical protein
MNENDKRSKISVADIFDNKGEFKPNGEELFIRKATGYISFVRGENPYTFPYRIYPNEFAIQHTFKNIQYPLFQMNGKRIEEKDKMKILDLYLVNIGEIQSYGYKYIIDHLRKKQISITTKKGVVRDMPSFENMESFGYTLLQMPLEALNIVYPLDVLDDAIKSIKPVTDFSDASLSRDSDNLSENSNEVALKKTQPKVQTPVESEDETKDESEYEPEEEEESEDDESEEKPKKETGKVLELTKQPSSEKSLSSLNGGENTSSSSGKIIIA